MVDLAAESPVLAPSVRSTRTGATGSEAVRGLFARGDRDVDRARRGGARITIRASRRAHRGHARRWHDRRASARLPLDGESQADDEGSRSTGEVAGKLKRRLER